MKMYKKNSVSLPHRGVSLSHALSCVSSRGAQRGTSKVYHDGTYTDLHDQHLQPACGTTACYSSVCVSYLSKILGDRLKE